MKESYQNKYWEVYYPYVKYRLDKDGYSSSDGSTETAVRDTFYLERQCLDKDFLEWFEDWKSLCSAKEKVRELLTKQNRKASNLNLDIKYYSRDLDYFYVFYKEQQVKFLKEKYLQLNELVKELKKRNPSRHFTLDGHLVGSIGEAFVSHCYDVSLYKSSTKTYDGITSDGKKVQIKITQRSSIVIHEKPDYLLALFLSKEGNFYEIYNGPGEKPWKNASKEDGYHNRHMQVNKLIDYNQDASDKDRIKQIIMVDRMPKELLKKN